VALFSIEQIITFANLVEALPLGERLVENLYITTYYAARENLRALCKEFYKPGFDTRVVVPSMVNALLDVRFGPILIFCIFPGKYTQQLL
jgi:hypothetical protein